MTVVVLVETVVLVVLCVLVVGLLRAHGTVLRRLHRLDGGGGSGEFDLRPALPVIDRPAAPADADFGPAHDLAGHTLDGQAVTARVVDTEHDTVLLFLSSGCPSCETFWADLARPDAAHLPGGVRLLVVPQSAEDESPADLAALAPAGVDVLCSSAAWRDYEVPGSPHVVFVDGRSGRVRGEGTGQSLQQVTNLLARATGDAGLVTSDRSGKPARDADQESAVDRELLAAGIVPGDPRLYGGEVR